MNFRNFGDPPPGEGGSGKPEGLARQSSVYSLTFDEFQSTWGGGLGKDFGSLNMDELLKNIWSAEETQAMSTAAVPDTTGGNLQRQGSLTLPQTLSQKTVEEVWKNVAKETSGSRDGGDGGSSSMPQRQQTLGEMTLEEFLLKAGVVREDNLQHGKPSNDSLYGYLSQPNNNNGLEISFQQACQNNGVFGYQIPQNNTPVSSQPTGFTLNIAGAGSSVQSPKQQIQQQPLLPKPTNLAFTSPMQFANYSQLASPGGRGAVGIRDPSSNSGLVQGLRTTGGLGTGAVTIGTVPAANQMASDVMTKSDLDTTSALPVPYVFNRGRKSNVAMEKVVERRQKRMIKNRESAAKSRALKQAYTMELEAEAAKLKELNKELQEKQDEMMKMQKNQVPEKMRTHWTGKKQCLRRTLTGPW